MATFVKFECYSEDLGKGVHNFSAHTFKIYLSNAAPNAATNTVKANIAEIASGNGYTSGGHSITPTFNRSGAVSTVGATDITLTASGGSIGPFQYVILYNDSSASDSLIGYWAYPSSITVAVGENFVIDFATGVLTIT